MRRIPAVVAAVLGLFPAGVLAQPAPEPPLLKLPVGSRVRVRTAAAPDAWIKGVLVGADSRTIGLVPEGAPPLGDNEFRLPSPEVTQLDLVTGTKRHWLPGLLIGAAAGLAIGASAEVDPVRCEFDDNYFCSRGSAVAAMGGFMAVLGAGVGALVKSDVWTPVGLDALGPPPFHVGTGGLALRATPGGLSLGLTVRF